jgi:trehalose 6-phosphate synthase/phosphatase
MNSLRRREKDNDVIFWLRSFMKQMGSQIEEEDADEVKSVTMHPLTMDDFEEYLAE